MTWKRILLSVTVLAACLLLAEVLLRGGVLRSDRHDAEQVARAWKRARQRVLVLGDSFLASEIGGMISDGLATHGIADFNTAVHGMGPYEYLDRLDRAQVPSEPDLVLLGFYVGNDLTNVRDRSGNRAMGTDPVLGVQPWTRPYLLDRVREELAPRTAHAFEWDHHLELGVDPELVQLARDRRINPWLLDLVEHNPTHLLDNVLVEGEQNEAAWATVEELILTARDRSSARGAQFALVVFPRSIQIDDSHFAFFERIGFDVDERTIGSRIPQDRLARLCAANGIPMLDLLPLFTERQGEQYYLDLDDHLNGDGNRLSARAIVAFVLEQLGTD